MVHQGDTIPVLLWVDPATGQKLIDDVHIQQPSQALRGGFASTINRQVMVGQPRVGITPPYLLGGPDDLPIPTVSGTARDFSVRKQVRSTHVAGHGAIAPNRARGVAFGPKRSQIESG